MLRETAPAGSSSLVDNRFIYTRGFEPFMLTMKTGALAGLMIASPLIIYQLWLFIAPGLYSHEKKFAIPFVFFCTIFFLTGAAFSHWIAFPWTWAFFMSWQNEYMQFLPNIGDAFSIYVKMLLAFGLIFQMPTIVFFLARMRVVTAGFLARHTKYAVLIIFIVAAVISPGTDVVSQALMAGPMLGLYGISILIAWIVAPRPSTIR
jgi:sec-independent protein translocase protein TatC